MGSGALMPTLSQCRIADLLAPYYAEPSSLILAQLSTYLDLLVKWNAKTNLTAIRDPEEMVRRHFGESLFASRHVPKANSLLDLGSGAGFPGIPIQLARPELSVTLAESQNKKVAFLREVVRTLSLPSTVWGQRTEALPVAARFDIVALRAVDRPELALLEARRLLKPEGTIVHLGGSESPDSLLIPGISGAWLQIIT